MGVVGCCGPGWRVCNRVRVMRDGCDVVGQRAACKAAAV